MPLIVGAGAADRANLPVVLFGVSAVFGFLTRTPIELAFRQATRRTSYLGWAVLYSSVAAASIIALLACYERWWLLPLGLPTMAGPAVVVSSRALRFRWRDFGQLLVVASLSVLAPAAHYAAVGSLKAAGFSLWLLSALYGGSTVFYIRMLLDRRRPASDSTRPNRRLAVVFYHVALVGLLALIVLAGDAPLLVAASFAPLLANVAYRVAKPPDRLDVQKTGLFEASQAALFAVLVIVAYRIG